MFRPAGIPEAGAHGQIADRAFQKIREGAQSTLPLRMVINGQHANPSYALQIATHTRSADLVPIAPYFQHALAAGLPRAQRLSQLFAEDGGKMQVLATALQPLGKELAISEVNLHTSQGNALTAKRDRTTAGAAAGSAPAKRLIEALGRGAVRQCVYVLAEYDAWLEDRSGFVKLWGIVRDLTAAGRFRPTGLGLLMLNRVIVGDLHRAQNPNSPTGTDITLSAFHAKAGWSAAMVSAVATPRDVVITFPLTPPGVLPRQMLRLAADDPEATNEQRAAVHIVQEEMLPIGNAVQVTFPPWGFVVLLPPGEKL